MNDLMRLQIAFDLPPSLAKILMMLVDNEVVTPRMVELDSGVTKDVKVAMHRLRRRLLATSVAIQSRRDVGYWVGDASREVIRSHMKDSTLGGGVDSGKAAP